MRPWRRMQHVGQPRVAGNPSHGAQTRPGHIAPPPATVSSQVTMTDRACMLKFRVATQLFRSCTAITAAVQRGPERTLWAA